MEILAIEKRFNPCLMFPEKFFVFEIKIKSNGTVVLVCNLSPKMLTSSVAEVYSVNYRYKRDDHECKESLKA